MSFFRAKSRQTNQNAYLQNRLANFTNPPMRTGNLHVEKNETVGGNLDISGNLKATSFYATGNFYLDSHILIPPGTVIQSAAITAPAGWFDCDGASLNKVTYAGLFAAIGNTYGGLVGDLSFNLPDARGRVCVGAGAGPGLTERLLGVPGGAETHTLTSGEIPSHTHESNAVGGTIGLITSDGSHTGSSGLDTTTGEPNLFAALPALTINNTGGGAAHNNMQPFIVLRYLIKY
jgi:microcystin-dependent protein